jgi:hypothetical protein
MNITEAILHLNPEAKFVCWENDYNRITWNVSNTKAKPSLLELKTVWVTIETNKEANTYQELRAAEYPPIGDQLDDIYHNGLTKWKATIKVIKDKYPKS